MVGFAFCFFMIEGEIKLKRICIEEKGLIHGLFLGCDALNTYTYSYQITKRLITYGVKGLIFPYYIIKEK